MAMKGKQYNLTFIEFYGFELKNNARVICNYSFKRNANIQTN